MVEPCLEEEVVMFLTYLSRELRHRTRQAVFVALGLAVGIGLVITVSSVSSGVKNAQAEVLHSLYGIGTDITVTQSPTVGSGSPPIRLGLGGGGRSGTSFSRDSLTSVGLGTLKESSVAEVAKLKHVSSAAGALSLTDNQISGTISASGSGGAGSFQDNSFSVDGVDISNSKVGVLSSATLASGHTFTSADSDSDVALVSKDFAASKNLKVGSSLTIAGKKFTVIGIVSPAQGSSTVDVFIPLARAQALSGLKGDVNEIYVSADSSSDISTVAKEISSALPKTTVTTSSDLASEVSGSLSSTATLASNLGKWLSAAVLAAAFALAGLLTMSAVSRRVREFGTLKALGWRKRRVVGQVMGEALAMGVVGGIAGVALGLAGSAVIDAIAPSLTASPGAAGTGGPGGAGAFSGAFHRLANSASTVTVHLAADVTLGIVVAAVALAIAGGLLAGSLGGWRAARMRPADALAQVR
jgi:putative ABC transport system permease protein